MRAIDGDRLKRKAQKVATEAWKMKTKATVEVILNQFIDWINEAPTIEPDSDTVSRQQAIDAICDDWCGYTNANCPYGSEAEHYCDGCDSVHILKTLPPSQTRPQAEMIQESYYSDKLVCSNCGIEARWDYEFCPYCGFKFKQTGGAE